MMPTLQRQLLAAAIAGLFLLASAGAQEPEPTIEEQLVELFADWDRDDTPGAAVAIIQDGTIVYQGAFGMADLERGVPLTPDSVFEIGSISKQFTAMCILLLEDDGELSLDDDIRTHVPEMPEYDAPITIRHLLHHTSGVRDVETLIPLAGWPWFNYYSVEQQLELIVRQQGLNFSPNTEYLYSNSGYLLLAFVVERVSGQSLREFAQERIFGPLGMEHTVFWERPGQVVPGRALSYSPRENGGWQDEMWNLPFGGPAGVYTTVGDLALWDANFYDNQLGGGSELTDRMQTTGVLENGESIDYAAGLVVSDFGGHPVVLHGGAWMGYRAGLMRFPEQRLTVASLSNAATIDVGGSAVANLYLPRKAEEEGAPSEGFEPPSGIELPVARLADYEGTYWNDSDSLVRTIEVREDKLHYVRGGDSATELRAIEEGHFVMIGPSVRVDVVFDSGTDRSMTVTVEGQESLDFGLLESAAADELAAIAGSYWSEELGRELLLRLENDQLEAGWADEADTTAAFPVGTDLLLVRQFVPVPWSPQDVRLELRRDASGEVSGLTLSCEMVRGVSFVKRQ